MRTPPPTLACLALLTLGAPAAGAAPSHVATLTPQTSHFISRYASHMDVDGDRVLVGAFSDAFLYRRPANPRDAWPQVQRLEPTLRGASQGSPVALRGDRAAFGDSSHVGAVNFFASESGGPYLVTQAIRPGDSEANDQFGTSVELGDGIAFVGADNDDHNGKPSTGTVTLFRDSGGGVYDEVEKFAPDDLPGGGDFGGSMQLDGDRLAVAAYGNGGHASAVYVFQRNAGGPDNWGQTAKLDEGGRFFGYDVALDGDTLLASTTARSAVADSVSVYGYDEATADWTLTKRLLSPDPVPGDQFGYAVALSGDLAVVARRSVESTIYPGRPGAAYVFRRDHGGPNNWGLLATLESPDPSLDYAFGESVAVMDNLVLVGSLGFSPNPLGSVYIYAVPEPGAGPLVALAASVCLAARGRCATGSRLWTRAI